MISSQMMVQPSTLAASNGRKSCSKMGSRGGFNLLPETAWGNRHCRRTWELLPPWKKVSKYMQRAQHVIVLMVDQMHAGEVPIPTPNLDRFVLAASNAMRLLPQPHLHPIAHILPHRSRATPTRPHRQCPPRQKSAPHWRHPSGRRHAARAITSTRLTQRLLWKNGIQALSAARRIMVFTTYTPEPSLPQGNRASEVFIDDEQPHQRLAFGSRARCRA